jgi:hypothetical protein
MQAIKQIIEVKNHTFTVVLPDDFTASSVEVIILPTTSATSIDVPQWQQDEVLRRLELYKKNPESAVDFDEALDEIEKGL